MPSTRLPTWSSSRRSTRSTTIARSAPRYSPAPVRAHSSVVPISARSTTPTPRRGPRSGSSIVVASPATPCGRSRSVRSRWSVRSTVRRSVPVSHSPPCATSSCSPSTPPSRHPRSTSGCSERPRTCRCSSVVTSLGNCSSPARRSVPTNCNGSVRCVTSCRAPTCCPPHSTSLAGSRPRVRSQCASRRNP